MVHSTAVFLLQRQMEVSGGLREKITSEAQLLAVRQTFHALSRFMQTIAELALSLRLPDEVIVQCLMQIGVGGAVAFDRQHRDGNVPMHQAKVLDRNSLLQAQQVEPALRKAVPGDALATLVEDCRALRTLLRVKVEDGNDFAMARQMVAMAREYVDALFKICGGDGKKMLRAYNATSEDALVAVVGEDGLSLHVAAVVAAADVVDDAVPMKPLPKNLLRGFEAECDVLKTTKTPFARRQQNLAVLLAWVQEAAQEDIDPIFEEILAVIAAPVAAQLTDKRSAIFRAAAAVVSFTCMRLPPALLSDGPRQSSRVRELVGAWLDALFKALFVTVSAIAEAADETARDIVIAATGAAFCLRKIADALRTAQQVELKRRLLNLLSVGLLAMPHNGRASETAGFVLAPLPALMQNASDGAVRKAARTAFIVGTRVCGLRSSDGAVDPKVQKLLDGEAGAVEAACSSIEDLEIGYLGYSEPSKASLFWSERCEGRGSPARGQRGDGESLRTSPPVKAVPRMQEAALGPCQPAAARQAQTPSLDGPVLQPPSRQPPTPTSQLQATSKRLAPVESEHVSAPVAEPPKIAAVQDRRRSSSNSRLSEPRQKSLSIPRDAPDMPPPAAATTASTQKRSSSISKTTTHSSVPPTKDTAAVAQKNGVAPVMRNITNTRPVEKAVVAPSVGQKKSVPSSNSASAAGTAAVTQPSIPRSKVAPLSTPAVLPSIYALRPTPSPTQAVQRPTSTGVPLSLGGLGDFGSTNGGRKTPSELCSSLRARAASRGADPR